MVRKSYGKMRGTKKRLTMKSKPTVNRFLTVFELGDVVHIDMLPPEIPHPKFHGRTGKILNKRGRGYEVEVGDLNAKKKIYLKPEHLKKVVL